MGMWFSCFSWKPELLDDNYWKPLSFNDIVLVSKGAI